MFVLWPPFQRYAGRRGAFDGSAPSPFLIALGGLGVLALTASVFCTAIRESTYIQVLENRIEFNYPTSFVTCSFPDFWRVNCHVQDNIGVIYYDRSILQNVAPAECCTPCCTHNRCCPNNCGCTGEAIILYENRVGAAGCANTCACCHVFNVGVTGIDGVIPRHCCGAQNLLLGCIKDSHKLVWGLWLCGCGVVVFVGFDVVRVAEWVFVGGAGWHVQAEVINEARDSRLRVQNIVVETAMIA